MGADAGTLTPIGTARALPCAGNPWRPGAKVNDCPNEAVHIVVGLKLMREVVASSLLGDIDAMVRLGASTVVLGACDGHVLGLKEWASEHEPAMVTSIDALPVVLDELGEDAWLLTRETG
jgi:hypothetical protein